MIHACASAASATGADRGWSAMSTTAAAMKGTVWATVVSVHSRAARSTERADARGRQWTVATSGRARSAPAPAGSAPAAISPRRWAGA